MDNDGQDFYKAGGPATAVADPTPEAQPPAATGGPRQPAPPAGSDSISWTAAEYTHHHKSPGWFAALFAATAVLAAATYFITKDYFATGTIVVLGIIVGSFGARKPRDVSYELSGSGFRVGQKLYTFNQFKSFSIIRGSHGSSISLLPLKKLMPPVEADFGPADEEKIMDIIGQHLPYEERKQAGIDRLSAKLKF